MGLGTVVVFVYEKEVVNSFTKAANKYLKTKIDGEIEGLTLLDKFPQASISMKNVVIHGSLESHKEKLAELDQIYFTISLLDLIQEKYNINSLYLENGYINLYVNSKGENNYTFLEKKNDHENEENLHFDFKNIEFINTQINYENHNIKQNHRLYAYNLSGKLKVIDKITEVALKSNCTVEYLEHNNTKYLSNKTLLFDGNLHVDTDKKIVKIPSLNLNLASSNFATNGDIYYGENTYNINIKAQNTDFKTLLSLAPANIANGFKKI